ncbi:hypothetical protein [Actinocrispum sp. NPDC049592]|uniref:hypothetical protein n=1 Tax=Actinocrispum sp. NPDC049592 TaxID=3154835 RepID=UPI003420A96A
MIRMLTAVVALLVATAAPASAAPQTYADYTMMLGKNAGQVWSGGAAASQWAWIPLAPNEFEIQWGDPGAWPPSGGEHFVNDGGWVLVDGYFDHKYGTFNRQTVTEEYIGEENCLSTKAIPSNGGRQHYARWTIPATAYCLTALGTITVGANGAVVHFKHEQVWYPPAPCSNSYLGARTCIRQHERWYDDNGHDFSLSLERDQYIARGTGMAFKIHHTYDRAWPAGHAPWDAELYSTWVWQ